MGSGVETVIEVGPLAADAARELLVARARHRAVDVAHDPRLAELADRLDGLPLALELAAGRLGVLSVPDVLDVTAWTGDGLVMGLRHRTLDVEGVQFHPESILTTDGMDLLANFLGRCAGVPA